VVYEAAVVLMARRGYHGTSLRDIANAANLRVSSVYYHYPSKQDILLAIVRRTMSDLTDKVSSAVVEAGDDPADQLAAAIGAHVLFHAQRPAEAFIADSEIRSLDPVSLSEVIALRDAYERIFLDALVLGHERGVMTLGDATIVKNAMLSATTGVATWYRDNSRLTPEQIAREMASLFLQGVGVTYDSRGRRSSRP
jgi:AcrR family transcriptional regulator